MTTPFDVAKWMADQLTQSGTVYQEQVVWDIEKTFGSDFVYMNEGGNPAISRAVLKEFRKLTDGTAIWSRSERFWRLRDKHDSPGRQQD